MYVITLVLNKMLYELHDITHNISNKIIDTNINANYSMKCNFL